MGLFGPKRPKPMSFKAAVEKTADAIKRMEANAVTPDELKAVAECWQALVSELNPVPVGKPEDK